MMETAISYPTEGGMGKTGTWRIFRPVVDNSKCINCRICWVYCPDTAIKMLMDLPENEGKNVKGIVIDYDYCKGCGICANECPVKAIKMEREEK